MQRGAAQIAVDQDDRLARLGADDREIVDGGRFALARAAAEHRHARPQAVLDLEVELRAQDAVALRVRQPRRLLGQRHGAALVRDDGQHRQAEELLRVGHGLDAGVEILDQEGHDDAAEQARKSADADIQADIRRRGNVGHLRRRDHLHGAFQQVVVAQVFLEADVQRIQQRLRPLIIAVRIDEGQDLRGLVLDGLGLEGIDFVLKLLDARPPPCPHRSSARCASRRSASCTGLAPGPTAPARPEPVRSGRRSPAAAGSGSCFPG